MIVGLVGAFLTAAYMTRCVYLTFLGKPRGASAGLAAHGDEEHEIDDDRVLVDAGVVGATVTAARADRHPGRGGDRRGPRRPKAPLGHVVPSDAHADHGEHTGPHESSWLITVPLIILAFGALVAGFLEAPAFKTEKFKEWVEPAGVTVLYDEAARSKPARSPTLPAGGGEPPPAPSSPGRLGLLPPELNHAEFAWSKAAVSIVLVLAGIAVSGLVCWAFYERKSRCFVGLTDAQAPGRGRLQFLNKYYLDFLYENGVVGGDLGADRQPS